MSIKTVIVDDELDAVEVMSMLLSKSTKETEIVGVASSVREAVEVINQTQPDVVFLDVEMPELPGYELIQFFEEVEFDIVFVTAYDQYAIKAFEINAIDYLLKPINRGKLDQTLEKVTDTIKLKQQYHKYKKLIESLSSNQEVKITLNEVGKKRVVNLDSIIAVEAEGTYSKVYTLENEKPILVSKNIGAFESYFPSNNLFFRSHKSWYINKNHILSYAKTKGVIELSNHVTAKLSKYKKGELEAFTNKKIKK